MTELLKLLGPTARSYDNGIFMDEFQTLVDWLEKAGDADELKYEMKLSEHQGILATAHFMFSRGAAARALESAAIVLLQPEVLKGTVRGNLLAAEAALLIARCRITSTFK